MPKEKACLKCSAARAPGQAYCPAHYAEYMRDYRPAAMVAKQTQNRAEGFRDGVAACVRYFRERVGGTAITGLQAARNLEREVIGGETGEQKQRRELLTSLRGL